MKTSSTDKNRVFRLVILSAFIAIMCILGFTPVGLIRLGFCNATTLCLPVIAGAILLGYKGGLVLGAVFGAISAIGAFGQAPSALMSPIVAASPVLALLICFIPRLTVPVVSWAMYTLSEKNKAMPYVLAALVTLLSALASVNSVSAIESKLTSSSSPHTAAVAIAIAIPAAWVIVFGTIFVICRIQKKQPLTVPVAAAVGSLTNTVLYLGMIYVVYLMLGLDAASILEMLIGFGLLVGMIEAIVSSVVAPAVLAALNKVGRGRL